MSRQMVNAIYHHLPLQMGRAFQDITNVSDKNVKLVIRKSGQRRKLMRWLFEVVLDFEYSHVTYARAVYIVDKFVLDRGLDIKRYQLLGIAALFVSAKLEERTVKKAVEYSIVTDTSFSVAEIVEMERAILLHLDYQLHFLLPHYYVTQEELLRLNVDLCMEDRRLLFYSAISYVLECEEANGNIFGTFARSRALLTDILQGNAPVDDMMLYANGCTRIVDVLAGIKVSAGL